MTPFHLKIVTPDGLIYDGQAEELIVRSTNGDVAILARHINYVTPLGMGRAVVVADGQRRNAACIGGMLSVVDGEVTPTRCCMIRKPLTPMFVWRKPDFTGRWFVKAWPPTNKRNACIHPDAGVFFILLPGSSPIPGSGY